MQATFPEGRQASVTGKDRGGRPITLKAGDRVRYRTLGTSDVEVEDTVRVCFFAYILVAPYAANYSIPAVVLHHVSWLPLTNVEKVDGPS